MKKLTILVALLAVSIFTFAQNGWQNSNYTFPTGTQTSSNIGWNAPVTITIPAGSDVTFNGASYAGGDLVVNGSLTINANFQLGGNLTLGQGAKLIVNGNWITEKTITYPLNAVIKITGEYEINQSGVVTIDRPLSFEVGKLHLKSGNAAVLINTNTTVTAGDVETSGAFTVSGVINVTNLFKSNTGDFTLNTGARVTTKDFAFHRPNNKVNGTIKATGTVEFHNKPTIMTCPGRIITKDLNNYSGPNPLEGKGYIMVSGTFYSPNALTASAQIVLNAPGAGPSAANKLSGSATLSTTSPCTTPPNEDENGNPIPPKDLPVNFGAINAVIKSGNVLQVSWNTLQETNSDHFRVEASEDGKNFTPLGAAISSKALNGSSDTTINYSVSYTISALALGAIAFGGLLFFAPPGRGRKLAGIIAALAVAFSLYSCSKNQDLEIDSSKNILVRVVQVDKNGTEKTSQTIKAIVE